VAISRAQLLKELLPGLNALFEQAYANQVESLEDKIARIHKELKRNSPRLKQEELDALTKLALRAEQLSGETNE